MSSHRNEYESQGHAGRRWDVSLAVNIVYWKHPRYPARGPALRPRLGYGLHCQTQSCWARPSLFQDPPGPLPTITPWQGSRPRRPCSSVSNLRALLHGLPVSLHHSQQRGRVKELHLKSGVALKPSTFVLSELKFVIWEPIYCRTPKD